MLQNWRYHTIYLPIMTELIPHEILKKLVEEADFAAVENVRAGRGGPFGASLNLVNLSGFTITRIGNVAGNAVLETGVGSAHAEDQALNTTNVNALKDQLKKLSRENVAVVVASSGESCPACHAKIEILARILMHEGLLLPGHFIVAYGASYKDTLEVAGFNDEPYHADMNKPENMRLIAVEEMAFSSLPSDVQSHLKDGQALVKMGDAVFEGIDQSAQHFTWTAEVSALRQAAITQKQQGHATPWDLQRAQLYTTASSIGPLAYAEAQWANIARIIKVQASSDHKNEAPGVSNDDLFRAIATRPYNNPHSVLSVVRITPFANKGQHEWALLQQSNPDLKNYNGVST